MPELTLFGAYPTPTGPEAADLPGQMMAFADALDAHTVLQAAGEGDRDAKYGDLPVGSIVTSTLAPWSVWLRIEAPLGGLTWATIYADTGWQTFAPSAFLTNWTDNGSNWRNKNGQVEINYRATYTGSDVVAGAAGGNIVDIAMMLLPSGARPVSTQIPSTFYASCCGNVITEVDGDVKLTHLYPGGTLSEGTGLYSHLGPFSR
jgi:hypothetical protein